MSKDNNDFPFHVSISLTPDHEDQVSKGFRPIDQDVEGVMAIMRLGNGEYLTIVNHITPMEIACTLSEEGFGKKIHRALDMAELHFLLDEIFDDAKNIPDKDTSDEDVSDKSSFDSSDFGKFLKNIFRHDED